MSAAVYSEPYKLPAGILALAVHGVFFALLYFGFTWQMRPTGTMSVELWQSLPNKVVEAPAQLREEKIMPPPQPEKVIQPAPVEPPQEKMVKPDIVVPEKPEIKPVEKKRIEPPKPDARLAQQQADRERIERAKRARAEQVARERVEQAERARAEQAARERAEQARAEQAAAIGRVVDEYTGKIVSKIRRNIVMPPDVADDARVEFSVTLLPGGTVLSARMSKPSGNPAYDNAVERAILKSQPLPLPADVAMFNRFRKLELVFKPVE